MWGFTANAEERVSCVKGTSDLTHMPLVTDKVEV